MDTPPTNRPMRTPKIFWGTLWIVAGILILLSKLDIMTFEIGSIWKFWPVIFVLWGISLLTGAKALRALLAVIAAVLLALIIYSAWVEWGSDREPREMTNQVFHELYDPSLHQASLRFASGAGSFTLRDTSAELFHAETATNFGKYEIDSRTGNDRRDVTFKLGSRSVWGGGGKNNVAMSLNPGPLWTLEIEVGAAQFDADLSPYAMDQVRIKTGVADVHVRLGDRAQESRVRIEAGVSSIVVKVPASAGCEISSESGLSSKSFEGFTNTHGGTYRTANFESAGKKIFLSFHAGVSSLKVERY